MPEIKLGGPMAKIIKEKIVIELTRVVKNTSDHTPTIISDELLETIESVSQELLGEKCVVEISVLGEDE